MSEEEVVRVPWACPKCGSKPGHHGKGECLDSGHGPCQGLVCECPIEDDSSDNLPDHGETFAHPCPNANCYHCGWGGTIPQKPKGLQPWEKKALEAGWGMPAARRKELGL